MLVGIADSSPRLSRKTYLHGSVLGKLQSGTMWIPVVLTARIGILKLSAKGCTATAELESVGPRRASAIAIPGATVLIDLSPSFPVRESAHSLAGIEVG